MALLPSRRLGCLKLDESAIAPLQMANCANLLDENWGINPDKRPTLYLSSPPMSAKSRGC